MKFGDKGDNVKALQLALNNIGYHLVADGQYGSMTQAAVKNYQLKQGLISDGIAGPITLGKLGVSAPVPVPTPGGHSSGLIKFCITGPQVHGYDVSHYQPNMGIHAQMAARGDKFCIIKSDEGARISDQSFRAHWESAKKVGMITSAYNFFHPAQDPGAQARHMENIIGKLGAGDLGPAIDWETTDGVAAVTDREEGLVFLEEIERHTGKTPIVYGGPYFLLALMLDDRFKRFLNWIAQYSGTNCALLPPPWDVMNFHQYTDAGGIDLDVYNGDLASLQKLAGM